MEPARTHRYQIEGSIGQGGEGEVFRAYDTRLNRRVALKRLLPEPGAPAGQAYAHALREATHLAALQHPHIVSVYDVDEDADGPYLIIELVVGDTLEEAVERGPFVLDDFLLLARQSLDALAAAHRVGLLHRDLKPSNVMLKRGVAGESFEVKLLDFGLSGFTSPRGVARAPALNGSAGGGIGGGGGDEEDNSVVGSVYFMAPEQFTREHPPDARTDLYALGGLLYYALTTTYPVQGDTVGTVVEQKLQGHVPHLAPRRPEVPGALCAWVMRLLAVRPEDRPESAARALEELQALRETAFDPARATSVPPYQLALRRTARLQLPAGKLSTPPAVVVASPVAPARGAAAAATTWPWRLGLVLGVGILLGTVGGMALDRSPPPRSSSSPVPLPPPARRGGPLPVLAAADGAGLRAYLGAEIVAEGRLVALGSSAEHTVFTLRFEPGADGSALGLVFFQDNLPPGWSDETLRGYVGHRVRAYGRLSEYRGRLQILVREAGQIEAAY